MRSSVSFWTADRGLTVLLVFLFVALLVAPPLVAAGSISPVFLEVLFFLILASGVATVSKRRWAAIPIAGLAGLTFAIRTVRVWVDRPSLSVLNSALSTAAALTLAGLVLFQVLRKGPINLHRVQGAAAVYLLLGLAWAQAYELVLLLSPQAFHFPDAGNRNLSLLYYSFVTLTTLGYGDITPALPAARSLAVAEALVGQLFPAILIARLVAMELVARGSTKEG